MRIVQSMRKQAGDTIVEVLIAIALVSLVLAGAYASTNHNVSATQDTQEHAQALQLVQSQLEFLRASVAAGGSAPTSGCYTGAGINAAPTAPECNVNRAGTANCTVEPCYKLSITQAGNTYAVAADWEGLISPKANVTLYYQP